MKHKGHLRKENLNNASGYDDKQGWIINNQFLYSDDAFKTVKSVFGEYKVPVSRDENGVVTYETYWGLLAEAVIAGYIEGSKIKGSEIEGGIIQIGDLGNGKWSFEVDEKGNVKMLGGLVEFSADENSIGTLRQDVNTTINNAVDNLQGQITDISDKHKYSVEVISDGPIIINSTNDKTTLTCKVYSWDTDITDTLDVSLFNWKRTSNNQALDEVWNQMPEHQGIKTITITHEDVLDDVSTSFNCEVNLPN